MKRSKLIIGNWKMYKTLSKAVSDFTQLTALVPHKHPRVEFGIAAPALFLSDLSLRGGQNVNLYAQNSHWEDEGAFTGEVSPLMLKDVRICGALCGHSERRQLFGETDATAGKRMGGLLKHGLKAVLCVGETLSEREDGKLEEVLTRQVHKALEASGLRSASDFIGKDPDSALFSIAYEPVWAIGTGKSASSTEAQQAHKLIRDILERYFNKEFSQQVCILYGGSVKPANISEFLKCDDVDGALVGGASLIPEDFAKLCEAVNAAAV